MDYAEVGDEDVYAGSADMDIPNPNSMANSIPNTNHSSSDTVYSNRGMDHPIRSTSHTQEEPPPHPTSQTSRLYT